MTPDELFMHRTFELAQRGMGSVSPNPLVGCVIVKEGRIIGEGCHEQYGQAHAEVNAVENVVDKSQLAGSTVYVNLEPCSHFGKTPPCADMLIRHAVKKVVISTLDTNPLVGGKGIQKLREAGIDVVTDVLEKEGSIFNRRFFTVFDKGRPYISLKWAQTSDGFIAKNNFDSKWISNELSRQWVHRWRSEEDAVLVGSQTVKYDNPKLTVRDWPGRNPVRIVLDRFLKLDTSLHVFDQTVHTLCFNTIKTEAKQNLEFIKLDEQGFVQQVVAELQKRKIQSVLIEGGTRIFNEFIKAGLWDEARVFISPQNFGEGISAPQFSATLVSEQQVDSDILRIYRP